jgi:hypothetical protein
MRVKTNSQYCGLVLTQRVDTLNSCKFNVFYFPAADINSFETWCVNGTAPLDGENMQPAYMIGVYVKKYRIL